MRFEASDFAARVDLDRVFLALANRTRRSILEQLARGECNVGELVAGRDMSQPAISKHLRVLEEAGLVVRIRDGRRRRARLSLETAEAGRRWITRYTALWRAQFDAVERRLQEQRREREQAGEQGPGEDQV